MKSSKNYFQVRRIEKSIVTNWIDLVKEIKESIIEHKSKLESSLAKKDEKKVSLPVKLSVLA